MRTDEDSTGTGLRSRTYAVRRPRMAPGPGPSAAPEFAESPDGVVIEAALACDSDDDFRVRIRGG